VTSWTRRLLTGAIAIMVPVLAGCEAGQDAPTLDYHAASFGLTTTVNGIGVSNAFVLGPGLDTELVRGEAAGVFMSLYTQDSGDKLLAAAAPGTARSVTLVNGPVELAPGALVNMSGPTPEIVLNGLISGLNGGQTVHLVLTFANAGTVLLTVPVEPAAYEYATFSPPAPSPSPSGTNRPRAKPSGGASSSAGASSTASPAVSGTASATLEPTASATPLRARNRHHGRQATDSNL
jgi:copper(I)-binding protein